MAVQDKNQVDSEGRLGTARTNIDKQVFRFQGFDTLFQIGRSQVGRIIFWRSTATTRFFGFVLFLLRTVRALRRSLRPVDNSTPTFLHLSDRPACLRHSTSGESGLVHPNLPACSVATAVRETVRQKNFS